MEALPGLMAVAVIGALVLIVVWVVLPFAVLGIKPLLRDLLAEQKKTNQLLASRSTGREGPDTLPGRR